MSGKHAFSPRRKNLASKVQARERFSVVGPLTAAKLRDALGRFSDEHHDVAGHHDAFVRGYSEERTTTKLYHLVREQDGYPVGFMGLKYSIEHHSPDAVAHMSVDFVFIRKAFRGRGLSLLLRRAAAESVSRWILNERRLLDRREMVRLYHAETIKTRAGGRFVLLLHEAVARRLRGSAVELHRSFEKPDDRFRR
jgi:GNAT superfamily N-acetyltransferase